MKKKILTICLITIVLTILIGGLSAFAQGGIPKEFRPVNEPFALNFESGEEGAVGATLTILQIIAGGLLYFAAPVAVIAIVVTGFSMVGGGADSETIEQAKKHLTWSVIGLIVIILSYSIVRFIITFAVQTGEGIEVPTEAVEMMGEGGGEG